MILFLFSPIELIQYFNNSGGLARLSGDFLTQFFLLQRSGPFDYGCGIGLVGSRCV